MLGVDVDVDVDATEPTAEDAYPQFTMTSPLHFDMFQMFLRNTTTSQGKFLLKSDSTEMLKGGAYDAERSRPWIGSGDVMMCMMLVMGLV